MNKEFRIYRAQDGSLKVSNAPQNYHYHLRRHCVERRHADFKSSGVKEPPSVSTYFTTVHWNWLGKEFGLKSIEIINNTREGILPFFPAKNGSAFIGGGGQIQVPDVVTQKTRTKDCFCKLCYVKNISVFIVYMVV